ncbi:MAG: hypothetical protein ACLPKH_10460, partial [Rhodomicrobium sp.]
QAGLAGADAPGIFWGWIFLRTNSLLGATVSHLMIGGAGIFLLGIEGFIQMLACWREGSHMLQCLRRRRACR